MAACGECGRTDARELGLKKSMDRARRIVAVWPDWMMGVSPIIRPPSSLIQGQDQEQPPKVASQFDLSDEAWEGEECPADDGGHLFFSVDLPEKYWLACSLYPEKHNRPASDKEADYARIRALKMRGACC